jgi:hypothetical protein
MSNFRFLLGIVFFAGYGNTQVTKNINITGTVTDAGGKAIPGVSVTLVQSGIVVKTDASGKYQITRSETSKIFLAKNTIPIFGNNEKYLGHELFSLVGARVDNPRNRIPSELKQLKRHLALAKTNSAPMDSLDILAIGFVRQGRALVSLSGAQDFKLQALAYTNVPYKSGINLSVYEKQMCTLDVHVPAGTAKKIPVIVHIHGGGLQEGDSQEGWSVADKNNFVRKISEQGYLLVCINYRLGIDPDLPNNGGLRGKFPDYLKDAAAAIAWAKYNVESYGGDPDNFFVMGYSAGAWLAVMLAVDSTYYHEIGFNQNSISGYIPLSAQTYTYGEYAIEKNISPRSISEAAALAHIRKLDIPMHLFVGGLETERISDDSVFVKQMRAAGTVNLEMSVMPGRDHEHIASSIGNAVDETRNLILAFLKKYSK